jgi:hypothetical protein
MRFIVFRVSYSVGVLVMALRSILSVTSTPILTIMMISFEYRTHCISSTFTAMVIRVPYGLSAS